MDRERARVKGAPDHCSHCGVKVDREALYCSNCRSPLKGAGPWMAGPEAKGAALPTEQLARPDSGNSPLDIGRAFDLVFKVEGIRTSDPVKVDVTATIAVEVARRDLFLEKVVRGRTGYGVGVVHDFLSDGVRNAFADMIAAISVKELEREGANLNLRKRFEVLLEHHLKTVLDAGGLYLYQLKALGWDLGGFSDVLAVREEGFLKNEKDEAEARDLENRIAARRKTQGLLGDLSLSDNEIEEFLLEEEKGRILRAQELTDIKAALEEREIDRRTKREWIIRKLELDQELDYERRRLLGKAGVEREVLEARYAVSEVENRLKKVHLANEMEEAKTKAAVDLELNELKEQSSLRIMEGLIEIKAKKERDAIENELYREKERLEIRLKEKEREKGR